MFSKRVPGSDSHKLEGLRGEESFNSTAFKLFLNKS